MITRVTGARYWAAMGAAAVLLLITVVLAAAFGAQRVDLSLAFDGALRPNPDAVLLFDARLPRVTLGAIAGAALGAVGASLQALLRNPLADPYVLGTSGGAALGGTLAIAVGVPASMAFVALPFFSFGGALAATLLVWAIAQRTGEASVAGVLLAGIVINAFASAAITLLKILVSATQAQELLFWLVGSIGYERWPTLTFAAVYVTIGVGVLTMMSGRMNLLALGDETAAHLGVDVARLKWTIFAASAFMVGGVVSLCGLVGFVGLLVPHTVRLAVGADHRLVVPLSALVGASFLVLSDLGARLLFDLVGTEAPVGAITAVFGCPVFLWLLLRRQRGAH